MSGSKLVYSTDVGRIKEETQKEEVAGDGNVRVRPEKKGRGGKVVTVISGLPLPLLAMTSKVMPKN